MSEGGGPSLADLETEVVGLRDEVKRLRGLLGLDGRDTEGHQVAWAPTLFTPTAPANVVDAHSSVVDKIGLLRSLFCARSDVYARRWENASPGKSGWSPAVRGGWNGRRSKGKAARQDCLPLTDELLAAHLRGELAVGVYPLMTDDTTSFLACDFDGGSWALDALAYLDSCHSVQVPAVLERSWSGNGAHVWIFFAEPVTASSARALGAALLRDAMTARAELDLASYDRFFPSQDFMPRGSFGNLIALPTQGERVAQEATVFLDPTTMAPWPDQWAFLSSVAPMSADAVTALVESLQPVNAGPDLSLADLASAAGPAPPERVEARLWAMLSIRRAGLPPSLLAGLKHLASLPNPVFYEKQRMRFSTWDKPRFIRCYREDLEWIHLPRGVGEQVRALVSELGSTLTVVDDRPELGRISLTFEGKLRPH